MPMPRHVVDSDRMQEHCWLEWELAMMPQNLNQCLTKNVHLVARSGFRSESESERRLWLMND